MPEPLKPMSQLLRAATLEYQYTTPTGEAVWSPFTLNNMPSLPDPRVDVLRRPGAGKTPAKKFRKAAQYAYEQVVADGLNGFPTIVEAIRTRLVDGSLPDDTYNYTGVDCSSFVTNVLQRSLEERGRDLYDELKVSYNAVTRGYNTSGWTPNIDEREAVLMGAKKNGGLSVKDFTKTFHRTYEPGRAVGITLLVANADKVEGEDVQPGDLAVYTPTDPLVTSHIAVVLDTVGETRVKFAHSGRKDPLVERGGIEIFTLPRGRVFDRELKHGHRGTMSIHRLRAFAAA